MNKIKLDEMEIKTLEKLRDMEATTLQRRIDELTKEHQAALYLKIAGAITAIVSLRGLKGEYRVTDEISELVKMGD